MMGRIKCDGNVEILISITSVLANNVGYENIIQDYKKKVGLCPPPRLRDGVTRAVAFSVNDIRRHSMTSDDI